VIYVTYNRVCATFQQAIASPLPANNYIMSAPTAPKKILWIIGLACGIGGIIGHYAQVQILSEYNYMLLLIGFIVLAIGTSFRL
jgi:hypothetical protein